MVKGEQRVAVNGVYKNQVRIVFCAKGSRKARRHKVIVDGAKFDVAKNKA